MADALILNYNDAEKVCALAAELASFACVSSVLIVDNGSTDGSVNVIRARFPADGPVRLIETGRNGGYGFGNNAGFRHLAQSGARRVLLCNPDIRISESAVAALESYLEAHENCLVAAPFMLSADGTRDPHTAYRLLTKWDYIWAMGLLTGKLFNRSYYSAAELAGDGPMEVGTVAGSLYMLDLGRLSSPAVYDERMFLYCEETVLGFQARQLGLKIVLLKGETFLHQHNASIGKVFTSEGKRRKLIIQSRMHLLKHVYHATVCERALARVLGAVSVAEVTLRQWFRGRKQCQYG